MFGGLSSWRQRKLVQTLQSLSTRLSFGMHSTLVVRFTSKQLPHLPSTAGNSQRLALFENCPKTRKQRTRITSITFSSNHQPKTRQPQFLLYNERGVGGNRCKTRPLGQSIQLKKIWTKRQCVFQHRYPNFSESQPGTQPYSELQK